MKTVQTEAGHSNDIRRYQRHESLWEHTNTQNQVNEVEGVHRAYGNIGCESGAIIQSLQKQLRLFNCKYSKNIEKQVR